MERRSWFGFKENGSCPLPICHAANVHILRCGPPTMIKVMAGHIKVMWYFSEM
ncbi:hypothetical protein LINGRAHAP2_LOCUS13703 [Linum grandiflorum]